MSGHSLNSEAKNIWISVFLIGRSSSLRSKKSQTSQSEGKKQKLLLQIEALPESHPLIALSQWFPYMLLQAL